MTKTRYAVVLERADNNWAAYVPDLAGCISTGATLEDVKRNIQEAIEFHIEGMIEVGEQIPLPTTVAADVEVDRYDRH